MNISKINSANAAKIYAEANKKLNLDKSGKNEKQVKSNDAAFEKDQINISREAKNMNVLDFVKDRIKADMSKDIPADKISKLKNAVKSGEYNIGTDALVSAIISGKPQV